ncbi:HAD family hydrolase [Algihabitans albus]|uniref:HAD family hydrolase n=1 Tax=Algihabitans albus TaxID=2164067 RepID=UPI000E5D3304|nr:HAD family phosphatase [Algihabitans albus]
MAATKAILFDLGGVLIDFAGLREIEALLDPRPTPVEVRQRWIASEAIRSFERGELSPAAFSECFLAEWGLAFEADAFLALFRSWNRGPLEGAHDLLNRLRPHFTLACLSNTNEIHWEDLLDGYGLRAALDQHYASHLLRMIKPDPQIYTSVADRLNCAAAEIVFFDDGAENVAGALATGMRAYRVEGVADVRAKLIELGLLAAT